MIRVLGVRVDEYTMDESVKIIGDIADDFRRGGAPGQVVTINPEGVWLALGDAGLRQLIERAALVTADGAGILWAAQKLGTPLAERVTGVDLLQRLCAAAARDGRSVYLLGSAAGVAEQAAARLRESYPRLRIAGCDNGYFREREAQAIAAVAQAAPDILFAGLGMPYQEKWLAAHLSELNCGAAIGVGGSFDVVAGQVRRAPLWLQKLRLEWLWRLAADPKRWRRYLTIPRYMRAVSREARAKK
ncbi:MAG: WecB/TagA/CpsF family glycosyltransferase [Bacillota bacterium]|nr:WecB/TagA/CpsF family glycosyltransferase [Bacillota bacterium]